MHPARITVLVAAPLAAVSLLLPYLSHDQGRAVTGGDGAAWPAVLLLVSAAVVAITGDRREGLPPPGTLLVTLLSAVACVFAAAKVVDAAAAVDALEAAEIGASIGSGAWLLALSSLAGLGGSLWTASRRVV